MRRFLDAHAPTVAAFGVMVSVFAIFTGTLGTGFDRPLERHGALPTAPIVLPGPEIDADGDTYADGVDAWSGDLVAEVTVSRLRAPGGDAAPYLLVGTQDDQWRTGKGAALEWLRVVDHDPLGHQPGSPGWVDSALRTGAWWRSIPMDGARYAVAPSGVVDQAEAGMVWPQTFAVNVRDDRALVVVQVELWDAHPRPDERRGTWLVEVDVDGGAWRVAGSDDGLRFGNATTVGDLDPGGAGAGLELSVALSSALDERAQKEIGERWAPRLFFSDGERFFPTRGEALERFHGFSRRADDHRTWTSAFNNGRDSYRMLLADFSGDGRVDSEDAGLASEILRAGEVAADTVYVQAVKTTGGRVVVQYWFVYFYNFVLDELGTDLPVLAHSGDREFMQLLFADLDAARNGTPLSVAYSRHYEGIVVPYEADAPPFHIDAERPAVFVARGSHASYPVAGTDRALRPSLAGFSDEFFGDGEDWGPDDYALEVLGTQTWHAGYLWGPVTRHSRDLGTATRPLLQHGFAYPYMDPLHWEREKRTVLADELDDLFGGAR